MAAGTLGNSVSRFVPLFESLGQAILDHQHQAAIRHGDETSWRIQSLKQAGRSARAWLWTSVTVDAAYFHIDPWVNYLNSLIVLSLSQKTGMK